MPSKARKRKSTNSDQRNGNEKSTEKVMPKNSSGKSSNKILILLVVMVAVTWSVAATAYFGLVDYKGLIGIESHVEVEEKNAESIKEPSQMKDDADVKIKEQAKEKDSTKGKTTAKEPEKVSDSNSVKKKAEETAKQIKEAAKKHSQSPKKAQETAKASTKVPTNPYTTIKDKPILKELEEGERLLNQKKGRDAVAHFQKLMDSHPLSPRAVYGKARGLFLSAEQERNNNVLKESIATFGQVGEHSYCPDSLKKKALLTKIEKHHFLGQVQDALNTARGLYKEFPRDVQVLNKFGVCFLWAGKNSQAASIYEQALSISPNDGFAQVHYGFIVKLNGDWEKGARYLLSGINSGEEGTQEGKFYLHLGDALYRTNRSEESKEIFQRGADKGFFLSKYQRSLYNVDRLKSHPFWTAEEAKATQYVKKLEKKWKMIRDEALSIMDTDKGLFLPEEESLKNTGDWKQLTLYQRGKPQKDCKRLPKTCALVEKMPNSAGCTRGQIKFSIMQPGTHVWAHTGPTNCRLRMHLGLVIPTSGEGAKIRCAEEFRTWEEGKVLIFDDSFEHEVWQNAETYRLILIIDVWHPDLTDREKKTLSPI